MMKTRLRVYFRWPEFPDASFQEEFFVGVWHPTSELNVEWEAPPCSLPISVRTGRNWSIVGSRASFQSAASSLVHVCRTANSTDSRAMIEAVAFRGYLLTPPIHSWSPPDDIIRYWSHDNEQHNGVFAAVKILRDGQIELIDDALGIASLYYRSLFGLLLFSTNSRFLAAGGDGTDKTAGRLMVQCGSVYGNHTLTQNVFRLSPGTVKRVGQHASVERMWFDDPGFAVGNRQVTSTRLREVEDAFQTAMDRCLRLSASQYVLPLSSGYDSRRILAAIHSRQIPFKAITVRVLYKQCLDLDARWSSVMAKEMRFDHHVVNLPVPSDFARLDRMRRLLVDGHGSEHTWFLSMHRLVPNQASLVFDGLAGDVVGNTAFKSKGFYALNESERMETIINSLTADHYDRILSDRSWPNVDAVRQYLGDYLAYLPDGNAQSELASLAMRCRSGPGMCFQRLIPAGHTTVYPYLDLDYLHVALSIDPSEKVPPDTLQSRCLEIFWPSYFKFPGTKRIPSSSTTSELYRPNHLWLACFEQLRSELGHPSKVLPLLTIRGKFLWGLALLQKRGATHLRWWLEPLLTILARESQTRACWRAEPSRCE